jgi:hypothetical protein
MTSERGKRRAIEAGKPDLLHEGSPFEEISGASIRAEIGPRFRIEEFFTFCPFWFYLAPKLRLPTRWRYPVARVLHGLDGALLRIRPGAGAYIFLVARND